VKLLEPRAILPEIRRQLPQRQHRVEKSVLEAVDESKHGWTSTWIEANSDGEHAESEK
jgi:hypothetical protein